ncbi:hypothetical protein OKW18_000877 [Streptomyces pratensis]|nr:hypothetical protein [Streptomyces pratensis]
MHDQEGTPVVLPGVEGGKESGVVEPGQDQRFAVQALLPAEARIGPENLDCDWSSQPQIEASVHVRGAARAEAAVQTVPAAQHLR